MRLRTVRRKAEACVQLYNGPIVLADGTVLACSCVASMDAADLAIGHVMTDDLAALWRGERVRALRAAFQTGPLQPTCSSCDMYRDLELYRTRAGRARAALNRRRLAGEIVRREGAAREPFAGG
jgi:radical SAM protein with 4Fe4S-binding SPASM domain